MAASNQAKSMPSPSIRRGMRAIHTKIFVGGLWPGTTDDSLISHFSKFGPVSSAMVICDPDTHLSRGFGFVHFIKGSTAAEALKKRFHLLDGKLVDVRYSFTAKDLQKYEKNKVFVGGISQRTSVSDLTEHFSAYGKVMTSSIPMDWGTETGRHRGFGFVYFHSSEVADQVCNQMFHVLKNKTVECKRAIPRGYFQNGIHHQYYNNYSYGPIGIPVYPLASAPHCLQQGCMHIRLPNQVRPILPIMPSQNLRVQIPSPTSPFSNYRLATNAPEIGYRPPIVFAGPPVMHPVNPMIPQDPNAPPVFRLFPPPGSFNFHFQ